MEMSCSGRSPSSRSAVARMATSRSSPVGRAFRRPRAGPATPAVMTGRVAATIRARHRVDPLDTALIASLAPTAATKRDDMPPEHLDVLIVGAGLSGIGAACHLPPQPPPPTDTNPPGAAAGPRA